MTAAKLDKRKYGIDSLIFAVVVLAISILSWNRDYFTYETETDSLSSFIREAQRIIDGQPLAMDFHPPLYPSVLALNHAFTADWFVNGRLISWISGLTLVIAAYILFDRIGGAAMARGALLAFILSPVFLAYTSFVTSDIFFAALFMLALMTTLLASRSPRIIWPILTGIFIGLVLLTRVNGLTHLILLAAPWALASSSSRRTRIRSFFWLFISFLAVMSAWFIVARLIGSPLWPTQNSANLALTYFAPTDDRVSGESRFILETQFDSLFDVIAYDPVHIAKTYVLDGLRTVRRIFASTGIVLVPISLMALPGLFYWLKGGGRRFTYFLLVVVLAQILLINLKAFETRYFLFLVPFLGAFGGNFVGLLWAWLWRRRPYQPFTAALLIAFGGSALLAGFAYSLNTARLRIHAQDAEFSEIVPVVSDMLEQPCTLIARKPHVPYYANCIFVNFPDVADFDALHDGIVSHEISMSRPEQPTYLYYGSIEKSKRSQFDQLRYAEESPTWLELVAQSVQPGKWALYRVSMD